MRQLAQTAAEMRTKQPEEFPLPPKEIILRDTTVERLFEAMLAALNRVPEEETVKTVHSVKKDVFTVRSCSRKIRDRLKKARGKTTFTSLVDGAGRMEIIVTFMSILEMITGGEIRVEQKRYCGEIFIIEQNLIMNDENMNYMDELD